MQSINSACVYNKCIITTAYKSVNHFQILLTLSRIDSTTRFIVLYTIYIHKHVRIYRKRRRRKKKNDTRFSPRISNFRYFCIASFAVIRITKNSRTSVCPIASFRNALLEPEVEENSKRELWKSLVGLRTSGAALENQTTSTALPVLLTYLRPLLFSLRSRPFFARSNQLRTVS